MPASPHDRDKAMPDDASDVVAPASTDEADAAAASAPELVDDAVEVTPESLGLLLPDDHEEAVHLLVRELHEARTETADLLDNLQRVAAEFDNYRKRVERDQAETVMRAGQRIVEALLPVLDSFDAAIAIEATTGVEESMVAGMRGTHSLLLDVLKREGCEPIEAADAPFDPAVHEAVSVSPGEGDQVVEQVLRKGYLMHGRVVRPALVTVGHA